MAWLLGGKKVAFQIRGLTDSQENNGMEKQHVL